MHHTAAWQLHLTLSADDVEWILYSRHIDCYSSPAERLSTLEPKYAWCCHQGTDEVDVFGACERSTFSHMFGINLSSIFKVSSR